MSVGSTGPRGGRVGPAPALRLRDVGFSYPGAGTRVLDGVSLEVPEGSFCLLVGDTGSGKTTLLRLCKPEIAPAGQLSGTVEAFGRDVRGLTPEESASTVGFVFQSPESQVVCDTVWHEMAFGLENLATPPAEMRRRVAETCYFLGMEPWFRAKTADLSGGQRQLLALAATLVMRPRLLLLDEPTSMLDPVAEQGFLAALFRANRELGVTVVVATHRPEAMLPYATCALRVAGGQVGEVALGTLREPEVPEEDAPAVPTASDVAPSGSVGPVVEASGLWLRYGREEPWVLRGCDLAVRAGEVRALLGGNGCGKSTLLGLVAGVLRPQHGRMANALAASQCLLPQSPEALLGRDSVGEELMAWSGGAGYGRDDALAMLVRLGLVGEGDGDEALQALLAKNPLDLSGGQRQLLALGKLLLARPRLLLLDEPTKGVDRRGRALMARALEGARDEGATVVMATHDVRFARRVAGSVSLIFDGEVALTQPSGAFFRDSWVWRA